MREDEIFAEEEQIADEQTKHDTLLEMLGLRRSLRALTGVQRPLTCGLHAPIREAITAMQQEHKGCVLVVEQGRIVGILTERDVLTKIAAREVDLDRVQVRDLMTPEPECLDLDTELVYAFFQMNVSDSRHIPVLDARGEPVGVISMRDLVDYMVKLFPKDVLNRPPTPDLQNPQAPEGA